MLELCGKRLCLTLFTVPSSQTQSALKTETVVVHNFAVPVMISGDPTQANPAEALFGRFEVSTLR